MTIETIQAVLGWSIILNYGVLVLWLLYFLLAHDSLYRMHATMINIPVESFDKIHYALMGFYKLCIFMFMLAPYLAIRIVT